jgi:CRISPR-associated protein Cas4
MADRELTKGISYRKFPFDPALINDMVERGYAASARETKIRKKESFAPSSIGYGQATCPRYWYMAFEGKYVFDESGTDNVGLANMTNGTEVHARLDEVFRASGNLVASEVEMKLSDPPVRGFIDALVRIDDEIVVGEFKSAKQEIFMHRLTTMKPAPYHMYQILLYLKATGKKKGFILYENKNDQSILVIPIEMDEENTKTIEDALDWMRKVRNNWEEGPDGVNLPKRPGRWTRKNKNCKGCPLFTECWDNLGDGTVDLPPMEVVKL